MQEKLLFLQIIIPNLKPRYFVNNERKLNTAKKRGLLLT